MNINKKLLISASVLVVLIIVVLSFNLIREKVQAEEFAGKIIKTEGDLIFMTGDFVPENRQNAPPIEERDVQIVITPETKITKVLLYLPGLEDVGSGGRYDPAALKRETVGGSKDDLVADRSNVLVKSGKNIFGRKKFEAVSIEYLEPVYP